MRKTILALLVACTLLAGAVARPNPPSSEEEKQVQSLVAKAKQSGYKNLEPIIGILTQPCSDCPGRYRRAWSWPGYDHVKSSCRAG
jgi:hypothetical protein